MPYELGDLLAQAAAEQMAKQSRPPPKTMSTWDYLRGAIPGMGRPSGAVMEPDLTQTQLGMQPPPGVPVSRRPNVLPLTVNADTGQLQLAHSKLMDVLGAARFGAAPALAEGEMALGQGLLKPRALPQAALGAHGAEEQRRSYERLHPNPWEL